MKQQDVISEVQRLLTKHVKEPMRTISADNKMVLIFFDLKANNWIKKIENYARPLSKKEVLELFISIAIINLVREYLLSVELLDNFCVPAVVSVEPPTPSEINRFNKIFGRS